MLLRSQLDVLVRQHDGAKLQSRSGFTERDKQSGVVADFRDKISTSYGLVIDLPLISNVFTNKYKWDLQLQATVNIKAGPLDDRAVGSAEQRFPIMGLGRRYPLTAATNHGLRHFVSLLP